MFLFVACILFLYVAGFFSVETVGISKDKSAALKSIMAILIVLHHLSLQGIPFLWMFHSWGAPIVSIFLFLSGYGLMKSLCLKGKMYLSDFFRHRLFKSIIIPFLVAWTIYRILNMVNAPCFSLELKELIFNGITVLPHSWFIFAILCFYIFFYVSYKFLPNRLCFVALMALFILFEVWCQYRHYDRCWYISAFSFPTGLFFGKYESYIIEYFKSNMIYAIMIPVNLIIIALCVYMKMEPAYLFVYILIPMIFAVLLLRVKIEKFLTFRAIRFLSTVSFEIYLSQGISMCILRGPFFYLKSDYIYVILTLFLTIMIAVFIKFTRRLLIGFCS